MKVFLVDCQVIGKIPYSPGQESDLHLRRAGVGVMTPKLSDGLLLVYGCLGHEAILSFLLNECRSNYLRQNGEVKASDNA